MPPPVPVARPQDLVTDVVRRVDRRLGAPVGRRLLVLANVLVLVVALLPFAVWEGLGPARFEDVELGQDPDTLELPSGAPLAVPEDGGDGWDPADLPFDLSDTTTVTLVFSVGSKGLDPDEAARLRVHDVGDRGGDGLTDTMMLVVADHATRDVALLSIPRDLWMHHRGHRINATFNLAGLQAFVDDVSRSTGLPIHHLVRLNFGAFARLVDAVGGVPLQVDRPLADVPAVLYVPEAGCWHFDGAAALAWARGRHTLTRDDDGDWVTDRTASDFGRIERQQALLGALWEQVRRPATIGSLPELIGVARDGLVVDDGLGVQQVRDLLAVFGEVAAGRIEGHTYPTTGQRIGGAAAQVVVPEEAAPVLTRLRTWPPGPDDAPAASSAAPPRPAPTDHALLAAGPTLALPDAACTRDVARALPDPRPPLGGVVASRGGADGTGVEVADEDGADGDGGADGSPDGDGGSDGDDGTSEAPDPSPSDPPSSEEPSPEPSPTESESDDDDGPIDLPLPGRSGDGG